MIKDDIVALLPDLRAFSRFLCREREAADDLAQNTILAALDKQDQFTPGTNLKGWLFTIMRNRFYSDLRTQRRRPTSIDDEAAAPLTAVDNPEATLALKELSSALLRTEPAIARGAGSGGRRRLFLRGGGSALRLLGRHAQGPGIARAQAIVRSVEIKSIYFNGLEKNGTADVTFLAGRHWSGTRVLSGDTENGHRDEQRRRTIFTSS